MKKNNILDEAVRLSLDSYFADLGDTEPNDLYDMVVGCVLVFAVFVDQAYQRRVK